MEMKTASSCLQYAHFHILIFLSLVALTFLFKHTSTDFHLETFFTSCGSAGRSEHPVTQSMAEPADLRMLVGVLTTADSYERRQLLRLAYRQQHGTYRNAEVDVRFILCNLSKEEQSIIVALEIMQFGDIIILNCTENMNKGKTYKYFSSVPTLFRDHPYHYVMKSDDDTYVRLGNLVESLRNKSRVDVYYGLVVPCTGVDDLERRMTAFMSGMGYLVSWDLAEWIAQSETTRNNTDGPEDIVFASWLNSANKGRNRYHNFPEFYDYKGEYSDECYRHGFIPETIVVHKLKSYLQWARTLKYFNATQGLKPSKLYHVPQLLD